MKRAGLAMGVVTLGLLGGCATPDSVRQPVFVLNGGQPIPVGLPHPETWVYLGIQKTSDNKLQSMTWVKPVAMPSRQYQSGDQSKAAIDEALAQLFKPLEKYPQEYSESFEYQDFPRPLKSPQEYIDVLKELQLSGCPSGSVTPIRVSSTELLVEMKSGGCERFGNQDEIDRFLFGKTDLFHMNYMVKSPEMTPEQREIAIKAVTSWSYMWQPPFVK